MKLRWLLLGLMAFAPVVAWATRAYIAPAKAVAVNTLPLSFNEISNYSYVIPTFESTYFGRIETPRNQIPSAITALNGKRASVTGFMLPIKLDKGQCKEFLLVADRSLGGCCWSRVPRMNEWISVKMTGDHAHRFVSDQPVTVTGNFHAGEEIVNDEVMSLYRIDADDVSGPLTDE